VRIVSLLKKLYPIFKPIKLHVTAKEEGTPQRVRQCLRTDQRLRRKAEETAQLWLDSRWCFARKAKPWRLWSEEWWMPLRSDQTQMLLRQMWWWQMQWWQRMLW